MPVLDSICRKRGGELNAMMRTTCAFTMMEGSNASNVLPPFAKMSANLRLIGDETVDSAMEYLKTVANDPDVKLDVVYGMNPSADSPADGPNWENLKYAVMQTWPGALVSPYLMFACSDSRHYCKISERVYRFSAAKLSKDGFAMIHGHNERISLDTLTKIIQFYTRLMMKC